MEWTDRGPDLIRIENKLARMGFRRLPAANGDEPLAALEARGFRSQRWFRAVVVTRTGFLDAAVLDAARRRVHERLDQAVAAEDAVIAFAGVAHLLLCDGVEPEIAKRLRSRNPSAGGWLWLPVAIDRSTREVHAMERVGTDTQDLWPLVDLVRRIRDPLASPTWPAVSFSTFQKWTFVALLGILLLLALLV